MLTSIVIKSGVEIELHRLNLVLNLGFFENILVIFSIIIPRIILILFFLYILYLGDISKFFYIAILSVLISLIFIINSLLQIKPDLFGQTLIWAIFYIPIIFALMTTNDVWTFAQFSSASSLIFGCFRLANCVGLSSNFLASYKQVRAKIDYTLLFSTGWFGPALSGLSIWLPMTLAFEYLSDVEYGSFILSHRLIFYAAFFAIPLIFVYQRRAPQLIEEGKVDRLRYEFSVILIACVFVSLINFALVWLIIPRIPENTDQLVSNLGFLVFIGTFISISGLVNILIYSLRLELGLFFIKLGSSALVWFIFFVGQSIDSILLWLCTLFFAERIISIILFYRFRVDKIRCSNV